MGEDYEQLTNDETSQDASRLNQEIGREEGQGSWDQIEAEEEEDGNGEIEAGNDTDDDLELEDTYKYKKVRGAEEHIEEGFQGSQIIEARNLKNLLLALLLSFIGYIIVMSASRNFLPIGEYAPHLKKFKNLIYVGIFYLITYMCLEIF